MRDSAQCWLDGYVIDMIEQYPAADYNAEGQRHYQAIDLASLSQMGERGHCRISFAQGHSAQSSVVIFAISKV
jgi:hypothetical protein